MELKGEDCARAQKDTVELLALPSRSKQNLKFGRFESYLCRNGKEIGRKA